MCWHYGRKQDPGVIVIADRLSADERRPEHRIRSHMIWVANSNSSNTSAATSTNADRPLRASRLGMAFASPDLNCASSIKYDMHASRICDQSTKRKNIVQICLLPVHQNSLEQLLPRRLTGGVKIKICANHEVQPRIDKNHDPVLTSFRHSPRDIVGNGGNEWDWDIVDQGPASGARRENRRGDGGETWRGITHDRKTRTRFWG